MTPEHRSGSPPLARGTAFSSLEQWFRQGITPARAGNSCLAECWKHLTRDHPRSRGEQSAWITISNMRLGSPPLARGTGVRYAPDKSQAGITPARAGNRPQSRMPKNGKRDHPRSRGEQTSPFRILLEKTGSPPLARGTEITVSRPKR